jgi:outer membrane protein OmpA-like peptidoglycan-associated protein
MRREPTMTVEISGHTDHIGSEGNNARISMARACAVASYLLEQGIAPDRLTVQGYGESRPVAGEGGEVECSRNRRVEFTITGK